MNKAENKYQPFAAIRRGMLNWWRERLWHGRSPSTFLLFLTLPIGLLMALPLAYILIYAWRGDAATWTRVLNQRIPALLWQTMSLAAAVTIAGLILGAGLAFLVVRTDLPGRRWWRWLLALPLAVPPYVGALTFIIVFGPRGWITELLGRPLFPLYESLFGTSLVLTFFCYPYAYLITLFSLRRVSGNLEEAARSCGLSLKQVMLRVTLPALRPALGAGGLLIALYVVSDFGAVAMLRYNTFVSSIYYQTTGRFDRSGAAILAVVLIIITFTLLYLEVRSRKRFNYAPEHTVQRNLQLIHLGRWRWPALAVTILIFLFGVGLPFGVMGYWSIEGIRQGALDSRFFGYILNSVLVAGMAAAICMLAALPVVYLRSRHAGPMPRMLEQAIMINYALPGVIIALGLIFFFSRYLSALTVTPWLIVIACFIRFLPQSLRSGSASLAQLSPRIDEAGQSLGMSPRQVLWRLIFPLILPGIMAGGALVFVSTLKELPATLLLRPPGFDTLAVRVWSEAHEGFYARAAPAAMLILTASVLPLKYLLREEK